MNHTSISLLCYCQLNTFFDNLFLLFISIFSRLIFTKLFYFCSSQLAYPHCPLPLQKIIPLHTRSPLRLKNKPGKLVPVPLPLQKTRTILETILPSFFFNQFVIFGRILFLDTVGRIKAHSSILQRALMFFLQCQRVATTT